MGLREEFLQYLEEKENQATSQYNRPVSNRPLYLEKLK